MKYDVLTDAISELDADIIENYFLVKERTLNRKKKFKLKGFLAVAACLALICSGVIAIALKMNEWGGPNGQIPDKMYIFRIGEVCENESWNGSHHSIAFYDAYLCDSIDGVSGRYLIFSGDIHTTAFSFDIENPQRFSLDLNMIKNSDRLTENQVKFEGLYSRMLSKTFLIYNGDGDGGEMNGEFSLVFSIDEDNYELIKSGSDQTSYQNNKGHQISLNLGVYWCGGASVFRFKTTDIGYVKSIEY